VVRGLVRGLLSNGQGGQGVSLIFLEQFKKGKNTHEMCMYRRDKENPLTPLTTLTRLLPLLPVQTREIVTAKMNDRIAEMAWEELKWPPGTTLHWPDGKAVDIRHQPIVDFTTEFEIRIDGKKVGRLTMYRNFARN
jgi:hypothetical protein